jgi:hypothetical protein
MKKIYLIAVIVLMFSFGFHKTSVIYEKNDLILSHVSAYTIKASDALSITKLLDDSSLVDFGVVVETSDTIQIYNNSTIDESLIYNKEFEDLNINDLDSTSSLEFIFYLKGDYNERALVYETLTDNGIDLTKSINVEDAYYSTFKIPIYKNLFLFFTLISFVFYTLYSFMYLNNNSKKIAIQKLLGLDVFSKKDIIVLSIIILIIIFSGFSIFSLSIILLYAIFKIIYFTLYTLCEIPISIKNKPIVTSFLIPFAFFNYLFKFIFISLVCVSVFLIPKIIEYKTTYALWNNVENYYDPNIMETDPGDQFDEPIPRELGEKEFVDFRYETLMYFEQNYNAIYLYPVDALFGNTNDPTGDIYIDNGYMINENMLELQGLYYDIDPTKGALLIPSKYYGSEDIIINQLVNQMQYSVYDENNADILYDIPVIHIDDQQIYSYIPEIGYLEDAIFFVPPEDPYAQGIYSQSLMYRNQNMYYLNEDNNSVPIEQYYATTGYEMPNNYEYTDESLFDLGARNVAIFVSLLKLVVFTLMILFSYVFIINKFLLKLYVNANHKLIVIKRVLGYSFLNIHYRFIISFTIIDIIGSVIVLATGILLDLTMFGILFAFIYLLATVFVTVIQLKLYEQKSISTGMKGEEC